MHLSDKLAGPGRTVGRGSNALCNLRGGTVARVRHSQRFPDIAPQDLLQGAATYPLTDQAQQDIPQATVFVTGAGCGGKWQREQALKRLVPCGCSRVQVHPGRQTGGMRDEMPQSDAAQMG